MKINKGTIKNINKKLLASGLALTLFTSAGCKISSEIKYKKDDQGYVVGIDGSISKESLSDCYLCKVENKITASEYYTIIKKTHVFAERVSFYKKTDLFTNQYLSNDSFEFSDEISVVDYLNTNGKIKDEYTEEELKQILDEYVSTLDNNKKLVKE